MPLISVIWVEKNGRKISQFLWPEKNLVLKFSGVKALICFLSQIFNLKPVDSTQTQHVIQFYNLKSFAGRKFYWKVIVLKPKLRLREKYSL